MRGETTDGGGDNSSWLLRAGESRGPPDYTHLRHFCCWAWEVPTDPCLPNAVPARGHTGPLAAEGLG